MPRMSQENAPKEKSWQARIGEATDALAQSFVESISYDRRLYKHDIAGSIAHATMLAKVGLITEQDRDAIENWELQEIRVYGCVDAFEERLKLVLDMSFAQDEEDVRQARKHLRPEAQAPRPARAG